MSLRETGHALAPHEATAIGSVGAALRTHATPTMSEGVTTTRRRSIGSTASAPASTARCSTAVASVASPLDERVTSSVKLSAAPTQIPRQLRQTEPRAPLQLALALP